jgi:hypothetical protein
MSEAEIRDMPASSAFRPIFGGYTMHVLVTRESGQDIDGVLLHLILMVSQVVVPGVKNLRFVTASVPND